MGAEENKKRAEAAYEAFGNGDAAGAMQDIDEACEWRVRGDNTLTGTYSGRDEIGELWGKLAEREFSTEPHDFIADEDKVVVLTTVHAGGETGEAADILTYDGAGKLVAFDTLGDEEITNRVFAS